MNKAFFVFKECLQKILNFTCNTSNMIIKYIDYCLIFLISKNSNKKVTIIFIFIV